MSTGTRLRRAMVAKGLDVEGLAKRLGMKRSQLSRYLNDAATPSTVSLLKLCKELDLSSDYVLGLQEYEDDAAARLVYIYQNLSTPAQSCLMHYAVFSFKEETGRDL